MSGYGGNGYDDGYGGGQGGNDWSGYGKGGVSLSLLLVGLTSMSPRFYKFYNRVLIHFILELWL